MMQEKLITIGPGCKFWCCFKLVRFFMNFPHSWHRNLTHYPWIRLRQSGSFVLSVLIHASFVCNWKLTSDIVCVITMTRTLCIVWFGTVKWQETGFNWLPVQMSVKLPRIQSLIVLPVCPTYCASRLTTDKVNCVFCFAVEITLDFVCLICCRGRKELDLVIKGQIMHRVFCMVLILLGYSADLSPIWPEFV